MSLTRHSQGSFRELFSLSLPLMISHFSFMAMVFVDRIFLAHYSLDAMNASATALTFSWGMIVIWNGITSISEVFVAQRNGSKRFKELAEPVWQMLWLSLFSIVYFFPLAFWGSRYLFGSNPVLSLAKDYFDWMMLFGPVMIASTTIGTFFIGQGRTKEVTILSLVANGTNIALDWLLIFGWEGWFAPMGIEGAALATCLGQLLYFVALFFLFLRPKNRQEHGTGSPRFCWPVFKDCVRIGFPSALFECLEVIGISVYYFIMTLLGTEANTLASICNSFIILLWFTIDGVGLAVKTVVGNLIGANKVEKVEQVLKHSVVLHAIFAGILFLFLSCFSHVFVQLFLPGGTGALSSNFESSVRLSLFISVVYLFMEGVRAAMAGVFTSAGDTRFLMVAGIAAKWLLNVVPMYLIMVHFRARIEMGMVIYLVYSILATGIYYLRLSSGRWKGIKIESAVATGMAS